MTVTEIDKDATEFWDGQHWPDPRFGEEGRNVRPMTIDEFRRGKTVSKIDDAIAELQKVDVNDRQQVANALNILNEARDEQDGDKDTEQNVTGSDADTNV